MKEKALQKYTEYLKHYIDLGYIISPETSLKDSGLFTYIKNTEHTIRIKLENTMIGFAGLMAYIVRVDKFEAISNIWEHDPESLYINTFHYEAL